MKEKKSIDIKYIINVLQPQQTIHIKYTVFDLWFLFLLLVVYIATPNSKLFMFESVIALFVYYRLFVDKTRADFNELFIIKQYVKAKELLRRSFQIRYDRKN